MTPCVVCCAVGGQECHGPHHDTDGVDYSIGGEFSSEKHRYEGRLLGRCRNREACPTPPDNCLVCQASPGSAKLLGRFLFDTERDRFLCASRLVRNNKGDDCLCGLKLYFPGPLATKWFERWVKNNHGYGDPDAFFHNLTSQEALELVTLYQREGGGTKSPSTKVPRRKLKGYRKPYLQNRLRNSFRSNDGSLCDLDSKQSVMELKTQTEERVMSQKKKMKKAKVPVGLTRARRTQYAAELKDYRKRCQKYIAHLRKRVVLCKELLKCL